MATCTPVRVGLCMALFPIVLFGNVTSSQKQCYPIPLLLYYLSDDATGQSRTSETQHRHSLQRAGGETEAKDNERIFLSK